MNPGRAAPDRRHRETPPAGPLAREDPPLAPGADGGADRARTGDPLVANQVLSQLSYSPEEWWA